MPSDHKRQSLLDTRRGHRRAATIQFPSRYTFIPNRHERRGAPYDGYSKSLLDRYTEFYRLLMQFSSRCLIGATMCGTIIYHYANFYYDRVYTPSFDASSQLLFYRLLEAVACHHKPLKVNL